MHRHLPKVLVGVLVLLTSFASAGAQTTIVVDGGSPDWAYLPETGTPTGFFAVGPDVPPSGDGSALLQTDETADGIAIISQELVGTPLDDFTVLSYWTYTSNPPQAPALQFSVDYDTTDGNVGWQGRLVFEPLNAGTVLADQWQEWDTLAGEWWSTSAPGNGTCPQGNPCTWAEVLAAFPDAAIHGALLGQFLVKSGSGWNGTITTYTDAIRVTTTGGVDRLYDFETTTNQVNTSELSENGWFSDDTRADGTSVMPEAVGTDLVSPTLTDAPEGTSPAATVDHDDDIVNQIGFELFGPPVPPPADEWQGAVHLTIDAGAGAAGKSQISHRNNPAVTADADGFGFGHEVLSPVFQSRYSWMADNLGNPGITGALKLGFVTPTHPGAGMSSRTGEDAWDKLLVYEPSNGNGGSADGTWQTEAVNFTTGNWWIVDRAAGISTTQANPMTLAEMASSAVMIGGRPVSAVWSLLTDQDPGEEAILTSIQLGIGSNNPGGSVYLNQVETSFYRKGMVTTFGPDPGASAVLCVPSSFDTQCEAVAATIQEALDTDNLGSEDVILVDSGTYVGNLTVNTGVMLRGANAGSTGCNRVATETVIEGIMDIAASDVVVDGFSFEGPTVKLRTQATVDDLVVRNNRFREASKQIVFNAGFGGDDVTIEDNELMSEPVIFSRTVSLSAQVTVQESLPGLYIIRNCFSHTGVARPPVPLTTEPAIAFDPGSTAPSTERAPVISDNVFSNTAGGLDLSMGSATQTEISGNQFLAMSATAILGQLTNSLVIDNVFAGGAAGGILLSENGAGTPPSNASTGTSVFLNCFHENVGTALAFSATQADGTISTNSARFNDVVGNGTGAAYAGVEILDVTSNYWGSADGPSGLGPGSGDPVHDAGLDFTPFAVAPNTFSTPCNPVADLSISKVDDFADGQNAIVGGPVVYTLVVDNLGPFDATDVQVLDPIPSGLGSCSWFCTAGGGATCSAGGSDSISDVVNIPVGDSVSYELTCTFDPGPNSFSATNIAFVSAGDQTDSNPANNSATERTTNENLFWDGFESGDTQAWSNVVGGP